MRSRLSICILQGLAFAAYGCAKEEPTDRPSASAVTPTFVELDSAQQRAAGIVLTVAGNVPADTITLTGTVTFDAARVSHVGPRIQGRVRRAAVDIGVQVMPGDTLVVLDSPELGAAQAHWTQARVSRDLAARNFDRTERLYRDGIVSQRRRLEVEADLREREASLTASLQALSSLGAEPDSSGSSVFVIRSPLAGEIVEKHATAGEVVGPESSLFVVGSLDQVWLLLDLYETDIRRVQTGLDVSVVADAYPDRRFAARARLISSIVDTVSRTVKVRVEISNPAHLLKPGMFVRAGLALANPGTAVGIPHEAVQSIDGRTVVFVPAGAGRYGIRPVRVSGVRAGGWVEVLDGLRSGEQVVTAGSFAIKAQLLRRAAGEEN